MGMDIKGKVNELVDKIKNDNDLKGQFAKEPVKTVEKLVGVDLPEDQIEAVVDGIKAKIKIDSVSDIAGKLKNLF